MKIAFIEDDKDSLYLFSNKFRAAGIECGAFESAEDALPHLLAGSHDLIITDVRLPGMSGVEMLRRLRDRKVHTPCILITAFDSAELAREALNASANYLLEKPFSFKSLETVVRRTLSDPKSLQHCVDRGLAMISLTGRETEVALLILKGLSNAEIASACRLSEKTVKQYVTQIFEKAGVSSRAEFFSTIFPV